MTLTNTDLNRIANLAKLDLAPQESELLLEQLNNFFTIVEKMQSIDTQDVEPMAHPIDALENIQLYLAQDVVTETNNRQANQSNAPLLENALFVVPKVIE